jgi:hypothetical protein
MPALTVALAAVSAACAPTKLRSTSVDSRRPPLAELWQEPRDLVGRDLHYGPGGRRLAPRPGTRFRFVSDRATRAHFIPKIESKIDEGLALAGGGAR